MKREKIEFSLAFTVIWFLIVGLPLISSWHQIDNQWMAPVVIAGPPIIVFIYNLKRREK
jgi:hypothetical protein